MRVRHSEPGITNNNKSMTLQIAVRQDGVEKSKTGDTRAKRSRRRKTLGAPTQANVRRETYLAEKLSTPTFHPNETSNVPTRV